MVLYGVEGCKHDWKYRTDVYADGCIPVVCEKCGAFGCWCDVIAEYNARGRKLPSKEEFTSNGLRDDENPNGLWVNPYVNKPAKE